jgi:hypothetical protein
MLQHPGSGMSAIFIIVVGVREYFENPDWLVEDMNPVRDCGGICVLRKLDGKQVSLLMGRRKNL